jgi:3-isopropylmalate/(R)-2-methylmalate dehydratase small subunit
MTMWIKGRAWFFGDDVNTDVIMPTRWLALSDPAELGKHVMEALDPDWPSRIAPGDIIIGGANFGCGSSREHAPLGLKGAGVACVVARSFGRIFYRNAINIGLPLIVLPPGVPAQPQGSEIEIDIGQGAVRLGPGTPVLQGKRPAQVVLDIVQAGGLMPYVVKRAKPGAMV